MHEDRSVVDLMTADYTFVNERLARHYGIPNVYGSHFRRVTLADEARRGLLGKGSILLATSHADRTAPVLRGKWILENLLGTPPPPPPANVPPLEPPAGAAPKTCASGWKRIARTPHAPAAIARWIRSVSRWRILTPSARGGRATAARRSTRRAS